MARAILNRSRFAWLALAMCLALPAVSGAAPPEPGACPRALVPAAPDLQRQYVEFRRKVEAGPLARHLGGRVACEARADGSAIDLIYRYASGTTLEAKRDLAIELTELRLSPARMSKAAALWRLRRTERWAFEGQGCGIDWKSPPAQEPASPTGASATVYRGETCNCQGRLEYQGQALKALVFRSAC